MLIWAGPPSLAQTSTPSQPRYFDPVSAQEKKVFDEIVRKSYGGTSAKQGTARKILQRQALRVAPRAALSVLSRGGLVTAAALLLAVGDNPSRLRSESSFAHLCGVAPISVSSGKTIRYRLNRGGNRDANRALHVVALSRMSFDPRTKAYVVRRTTEGKTKREIIRCSKRYIARELYAVIISSPTSLD